MCSRSWAAQTDVDGGPIELSDMQLLDFGSGAFEEEFDVHYGLLPPEETVLIRAYSDDSDDRMLAEIEPRFIVMFEPNMEFIRRIEVSSSYDLEGSSTHQTIPVGISKFEPWSRCASVSYDIRKLL